MAINFPTTPADNTNHPNAPLVPYVSYRYKSAAPAYWRDIRGTALPTNRFTNPSFQISQINGMTDGTNVAGLIMADEWFTYYTTSTGSYRGQLVAAPTPKGSPNRLRITVTAADTAIISGEWLNIAHSIEGSKLGDLRWGTASARQVILRFGWRSPAGTWNVAIRNKALTRSYIVTFTIAAGQANTDTEQTFIIPGDTSGVWPIDNDASILMNFMMNSGNTTSSGNANKWVNGNFVAVSGITNGWAVVGNTFELFDVGFYIDPLFTGRPPDFEVPDPTVELRKCQRYMAKVFGLCGVVLDGTQAERMGTTLPVAMRVAPALTVRGAPQLYDYATVPVVTSVANNYSTRSFISCRLVCSAGAMAASAAVVMYYISENDYIWAKAWQT